jgi:VIT1/CCC1 family predicted Fe2+/Mn2+ transporter
MEMTESIIYRRLAKRQKLSSNRDLLNGLAADEERHEAVLAEMTGKQVKPQMMKVHLYINMARILGPTFALKMLERGEQDAAEEYRALGLDDLADEEESHEEELLGMLKETRLEHSGSIVLGMSDALVELTGALAGLTFALQSMQLVALAGLVTGIAAAFSMGASEFLSKRAEESESNPKIAALFTWIAYLSTVFLLILPYLLISPDVPAPYGLEPHVFALACTLAIGLSIVAVFNFYVSVVEGVSFRARFGEMAAILIVVSLISFGIGVLLRGWLGVEV